jgi:uncharacterized membrane protein YhaH (DUF805 family)
MKKLGRFIVKILIFIIIAGISYNHLTITRYALGDEPNSFFPIVLEVPKSNPPRFELLRWSELKKLLAADPKRTLSLPVGERQFTLEPDKNFIPSVKFQVTGVSGGQRIEVTYNTDDYTFWAEYRVVGNTIVPVRIRSGHGAALLFGTVLGIIGTTLLSWLYTRVRRRDSPARSVGEDKNWYLAALKKYAVFSGRARRKECWIFFFFNWIIVFGLGWIDLLTGAPGVFGKLYVLAVLIPSIAVGVRRMHDTDHSGWWLLLPIVNLVFLVQDSQQGDNRFGSNPKATTVWPPKLQKANE